MNHSNRLFVYSHNQNALIVWRMLGFPQTRCIGNVVKGLKNKVRDFYPQFEGSLCVLCVCPVSVEWTREGLMNMHEQWGHTILAWYDMLMWVKWGHTRVSQLIVNLNLGSSWDCVRVHEWQYWNFLCLYTMLRSTSFFSMRPLWLFC